MTQNELAVLTALRLFLLDRWLFVLLVLFMAGVADHNGQAA
jgi:hypothetical protein